MLKKVTKFLIAAGAASGLLAATPANAMVVYQFWSGSSLIGQVVACESGSVIEAWGSFTGTPTVQYWGSPC